MARTLPAMATADPPLDGRSKEAHRKSPTVGELYASELLGTLAPGDALMPKSLGQGAMSL